jgi:signal peptidase I
MKNKWLLWAAPLMLIAVLWVIARVTGMLQMYTLPTPSNEPSIKRESIVFSSTLKNPKPDNFIVFESDYFDPRSDFSTKGELHIFRLAGMESDILEMKDGVLFRNKVNVDSGKNLLYNYIVDAKFVSGLPNRIELEEKGYLSAITQDNFEIYLTTQKAVLYSKNGVLQKVNHISADSFTNQGVFEWMNKENEWTVDNFGPLKIPKGFFFVMGDNRHNALDSRYVGFIKKENFRGTVLNK